MQCCFILLLLTDDFLLLGKIIELCRIIIDDLLYQFEKLSVVVLDKTYSRYYCNVGTYIRKISNEFHEHDCYHYLINCYGSFGSTLWPSAN